ncbi:helix-turn-helix transcriptional regulator [Lactococcus insecticola]|uniref:HTH cro/C1-type domain-containing protein n=1 Tax=Pseudolactococcus insecticola TaxID=2709158 RepID=A0A6A0B745_9LACT|nr:helix-turn-helix transcriptional regulator [Lactococcus insecticola]GFH41249.1 hypothetical protein Hs20B_16470 [Lactococcus insecticola]
MNIIIKLSLKEWRKEKKITQKDLAIALSVSPNTILNWENSRSTPNVNQAIILADLLKVELEQIIF